MAVRYNPNPARITEPLYKVEELEKSPLYTVLCGEKELTVYHTDSFDYVIPVVDDDSPLSFQVKVSKDFQKAVFRPAKTNVQAQISGRELSFQLEKPSKVTLELDGNLKTPLFILCTKRVPKPEKVDHLFESGKVYNVGTLEVKAEETVFLEEGSVVCGCVNALFAHGMRILGNGILNGCVWHPKEENGGGRPMIRMVFCDDVKIQGITMVDGGSWHLVPGACRNVEIEDVNIMSRVCTGDGIDIVGCEDVTMRNSFIRASDDCVCIKAASYPDPAANRDVKNILVNPGFWLIALLCVLFYSCVFPFQKFASELMIIKYGINENVAGTFAGLPALGALILTPVFGGFIDKRGKSASIMLLGSAMLICVHFIYAIPDINYWLVAIVLMIILGIAFSLVPSAMWPAVAKIFPVSQLGTAYALIFFIQNIGLWGIPTLIGWVLDAYCISGKKPDGTNMYDYTVPMCIFTGIACLSLIVALLLKKADKKYGYKLEEPNIQK